MKCKFVGAVPENFEEELNSTINYLESEESAEIKDIKFSTEIYENQTMVFALIMFDS